MRKLSVTGLCYFGFLVFVRPFLFAQMPTLTTAPKVEVTIYNEDYHFDSKLLLFSQSSLEGMLGLPQRYNASIGAYRSKSPWPPAWIEQVSHPVPGWSMAMDFKRNWDGTYFFYQESHGSGFVGYVWLNHNFSVLDTLWKVAGDPHGIWLTNDRKIMWAKPDTMDYTFPGDSLPVIGHDLYMYDPITKVNSLIWKRDNSFNSNYLNPAYIDEGGGDQLGGGLRDGDHYNWGAEALDRNILNNDRHSGYGKINRSTGQVMWWCGFPEGFPNTLTPINGTTYKDVQSHLGHYFHQISQGPYTGYYTWFDNGDITQLYSRVPVVSIDETNNTIELIDEFTFPWSQCMGSVQFLDDATFVVALGCNIDPAFIQLLFSGADSVTIALALQQMYQDGNSPGIYWMTLEGDTLATYTLPVMEVAYLVQVVDSSDSQLPAISIECDGTPVGALELTLVLPQLQQQWSNGNTSPSIMVSQLGSYNAAIPVGIGMAYTKDYVVNNVETCEEITGIAQSAIMKDAVLYPNPLYQGGYLALDINNAVDFYGSRITATNLMGQETNMGVFDGTAFAVHTAAPGMYFIALNGMVVGKTVIFQ